MLYNRFNDLISSGTDAISGMLSKINEIKPSELPETTKTLLVDTGVFITNLQKLFTAMSKDAPQIENAPQWFQETRSERKKRARYADVNSSSTTVVFFDALATTVFQETDGISPLCFLSEEDMRDLVEGRVEYANHEHQFLCRSIILRAWDVYVVLPADDKIVVSRVTSPRGDIATYRRITTTYTDQRFDDRFVTALILANSYVMERYKSHALLLEQVIGAGMHVVVPGIDKSTAEIWKFFQRQDELIKKMQYKLNQQKK